MWVCIHACVGVRACVSFAELAHWLCQADYNGQPPHWVGYTTGSSGCTALPHAHKDQRGGYWIWIWNLNLKWLILVGKGQHERQCLWLCTPKHKMTWLYVVIPYPRLSLCYGLSEFPLSSSLILSLCASRPDQDSTAKCCKQINNRHNQVGSAYPWRCLRGVMRKGWRCALCISFTGLPAWWNRRMLFLPILYTHLTPPTCC